MNRQIRRQRKSDTLTVAIRKEQGVRTNKGQVTLSEATVTASDISPKDDDPANNKIEIVVRGVHATNDGPLKKPIKWDEGDTTKYANFSQATVADGDVQVMNGVTGRITITVRGVKRGENKAPVAWASQQNTVGGAGEEWSAGTIKTDLEKTC